MTKAAYTRCAMLAMLACALPAFAGQTLEGMKAESGLRFSESSGLGQARTGAEPVWAGRESGRRANLTVVPQQPARTTDAPPSPTPPAPKASGNSLGTKLLVGGGYLAGALATAIGGPIIVGILAVGGGVSAAATAWSKGEGGWSIAKKAAVGAALGAASIAIAGAAAGLAVGRTLERIFKR